MSNKGLTPELVKLRYADDFIGDSISPEWNALNGSDATVVVPAIATAAAATNGVALLTSGTNAGGTMALNGVQLESQLNWLVSKGGLVLEARVRIPGIATSVAWFLGFTDSVSVLEMPFTLAAGNVLTSTASNAVGFLYDTASDDPDNWWAVGVANDADSTKQNLSVAPSTVFETLRVDINRSGVAVFRRNGIVIGSPMSGALQGPTGSAPLTPVFVGFARGTGAQRQFEIDYVVCEQNR
jgi:hypothetical protein